MEIICTDSLIHSRALLFSSSISRGGTTCVSRMFRRDGRFRVTNRRPPLLSFAWYPDGQSQPTSLSTQTRSQRTCSFTLFFAPPSDPFLHIQGSSRKQRISRSFWLFPTSAYDMLNLSSCNIRKTLILLHKISEKFHKKLIIPRMSAVLNWTIMWQSIIVTSRNVLEALIFFSWNIKLLMLIHDVESVDGGSWISKKPISRSK